MSGNVCTQKRYHRVIENRADLKEWLRYEKAKYSGVTLLRSLLLLTESAIIWKWQRRLRVVEYHLNTHHRIRYKFNLILLNKMAFRYGLHIPPNSCGKGLKIMHVGSVQVNAKSDVGEDCAFHINTALVSGGRDQGVPRIGNHVIVGAHAVLVGGVKIGDGVAIGANAVVTKSFEEENIAIAGSPAKKISNNGSSTWNKGWFRDENLG